MTGSRALVKKGGVALLLLVMAFEVVRSSMRDGDFIGYIRAGRLTLDGAFIYKDFLNTWPPFFSVFCVPLAWLDQINGVALRGAWTVFMLLTLFWSIRIMTRWLIGKTVAWPFQNKNENSIAFTNPIVLFPFLIMFRFVLDNQSNLQINILLLWMCLLAIDWMIKDELPAAASILALAISIKVYPIFLLFYFGFKKQLPSVDWFGEADDTVWS